VLPRCYLDLAKSADLRACSSPSRPMQKSPAARAFCCRWASVRTGRGHQGATRPFRNFGLVHLGQPEDLRPELLRRSLQDCKVEWVTLLRLVDRCLAPTPVGQEPGSFQSVGVAAHRVHHDREPELGQLVAVLADQLAGCRGEALRPTAGLPETPFGKRPGSIPAPIPRSGWTRAVSPGAVGQDQANDEPPGSLVRPSPLSIHGGLVGA
jgi:hypothetical protein